MKDREPRFDQSQTRSEGAAHERRESTRVQQLQQEGRERQPLPSALDILERRAQLYERWMSERHRHGYKHSPEYLALYAKNREHVNQLGDEVASVYARWTDRDQLIFDLYSTSVKWWLGLSAQKTQQFIARVEHIPDEHLREELRTAREALERKTARYKKMAETQRRQRGLTYEEKRRIQKEKDHERSRAYQRRMKEHRSQTEQQQPKQVFSAIAPFRAAERQDK